MIKRPDGAYISYEELVAENLGLHERIAFAESPEGCGSAHENTDSCGYCQRDAIAKQRDALLDLVLESVERTLAVVRNAMEKE